MHQENKMDIHITMGSEEGLLFIADTDLTVTSNPNHVQNIINQSKIQPNPNNDPILVFHFYVEQGKQKQAIQHITQALDQTVEDEHASPLQSLLKKPSQQRGTVQIIENPGCIILYYRFFKEYIQDQDEITAIQQQFDQFDKATLRLTTSLKGSIKHNNNNRTNVKVDYVDVSVFSDEISPNNFHKLMKAAQPDDEQLDFLLNTPALQMIGNLKTAQFELKLASFRQLKSYYIEASNKSKEKQNKPFPYVNHGIFRNRISMFSTYKNKVACKFDSHYNGEDVLMRLLKISKVFWHQIK